MKRFLILLILVLVVMSYSMSFRKSETPAEKYEGWKFSLKHAGKDSITVRYRIQAEARKMLKKSKIPDAHYYGILGLELSEAETDEIKPYREEIIQLYPSSKQCYDIAKNEFYDKIYPIWDDDHEKIIVIEKLLEKYTDTSWRRTMYRYLCYSLANAGDAEMLKSYLEDWRKESPYDYLPWYITAANYRLMNEADLEVQEFARKAFELSLKPVKPEFYAEMEWQLERRAAKIHTAYELANVLIEADSLNEAEQVLTGTITDNLLGIDDETTTCRLHYALARLYQEKGLTEAAIEECVNALIEGDSRNTYSNQADSLLQELSEDIDVLAKSRKVEDYGDVCFYDATEELGLEGIGGSRVAWGDFDNDGWEDFLLSNGKLFRNLNGSRFIDITPDVFKSEISFGGAIWGDVDNDGDLDIIAKDPENIWINMDNRFVKYQGSTDYEDNEVSSEGLAVGDLNEDGFLDIYLANYEGADNTYYHDQLFHGNGNGSFSEVTYSVGAIATDDAKLAGRGVNMGDFNNDGLLDIYVSNYRLNQNLLFENHKGGSFIEKALALGVAGEEKEGWWGHTIGSEWGDIDNDGDFDLITCNLAHPRYIDFSNKTKLYINSGSPSYQFEDIRSEAGIRYEETNSEPSWGDFDNDGYLDLYITNVYEGRRSFLYMSNKDNTFRDVTWLSGTRHFNGWGSACCDYDKDGDLDLLVAGGEIQLFRNETDNANNWLEIEVEAAKGSNIIGTRLTVEGRDLQITRQIQGGKGTTNQHSLVQHFGLGDRKSGLTLVVEFPSGKITRSTIKDVNSRYLIKEGK